MKKKTKALLLLMIFAVILISGSTLAYLFSLSRSRVNTIPIGYDSIKIVEDFEPPSKQTTVTQYKKAVYIENTGTVPCFVRMYVDFSDSQIKNISSFSNNGVNFYAAVEDTSNPNAFINNLPEGWVFVSDGTALLGGYFYFTQPIAPGSPSAELFKNVKTDYTSAGFDPIQYDILVYAESVQIIGTDGTDYSKSTDGWRTAWLEFLRN